MQKKRFHKKLGKDYDLLIAAMPSYEELQNTLGTQIGNHTHAKNSKSLQVLEIGCGTGLTTAQILAADQRLEIDSIDNEPVMLKQAKDDLASKNNRVTLIQQDALTYLKSAQPQTYDVIASAFTLHNFHHSYRTKVLQQIYRVLKPDGLFVNADKYAQDDLIKHNKELAWQLKQFDDVFLPANRVDLRDEWVKHYEEDNEIEIVMIEGKTIDEMKNMGFKNLKTVWRKHMEAIVVAHK
ncbi:MAG: tRNA (cmo5U34)-methyltransferase [Candidatus Woesearchaeota archaeon]|jgi:tRNA (cmo5U34)-methyltransferase